MQWLVDNVWLVPVYPLVAFLLIALGRWYSQDGKRGPYAKREVSMVTTVAGTLFGLVHSVAVLVTMFQAGSHEPFHQVQNWEWLRAGALTLSVGTQLDAMSAMMLFVVTFISLFIQIYTHGYMDHDKGYCRFFAYLALFNFSMLGLVLSTNLFQMYIHWELVGVSSYLLIGFWYTKPSAAAAAIKAFLMNRVGDFGLLIGILAFLFFSFGWWGKYLAANPTDVLLSFDALGGAANHVFAQTGPFLFAVIAVLIFMGPMAKSAQMPLHTWLPDAMEGPTPISALIHAATMVAAGVYLVGRVYPIFDLSLEAQIIVAVIGTVTALLAATIALTQTDIKKALAYSTVSQLGFMMAAMGAGAFTAALFHLFTHAFFKAMLFLGSGSVIHACEDEQDMRQMGGLWSKLPITAWTYLIGTISISGLFWTSGFWSKDEVLLGMQHFDAILYWVLSITAGLTSFYMFRTFLMTFTGAYRGQAHVHHESPVMVMPLVVLAVPSIFIGLVLSGALPGFPAFHDYINYGPHHAAEPVSFFSEVGVRSMLIGGLGALLAIAFYWEKSPVRFSADAVRKALPPLYSLFSHKWYFDEMYGAFVQKVFLAFSRASARFDKAAIDGAVNGAGQSVMGGGYLARTLQSGRVQFYIAVLFFGVVALSLLLIYALM